MDNTDNIQLKPLMLARIVRSLAVLALCATPLTAHAQEVGGAETSETIAPAAEPALQPGEAISAESAETARTRTLTKELALEGENELNKAVRAYQQRFLTKRHRVELQLGGGLTFNDPWWRHESADAGLFYHLTEQWAVGVTAGKYWAQESAQAKTQEKNFGLFAEKTHLQAGGMLEVQWAPLFGKFAIFGFGVVQLDAYLLAGAGLERTARGTDLKMAGEIGGGLRFHLLRWLTLSADVRDLLVYEKFQDCDGNSVAGVCGSYFVHNVFAGLHIGLWIPPSVTYRFPR